MKVIFLTGHRKSGTTLLSNLLDDVEQWYFNETDTFIYETAYITALENVLSQLQAEEEE